MWPKETTLYLNFYLHDDTCSWQMNYCRRILVDSGVMKR